ncbi:type II toxin-antitoxin system VapC family toxin [Methylohalobius crimeensis]|uniref:type II toxin-antitoxin system VapC family toxin n=1 Tax=Methylohalobius crimeensis TaxID=244365 RepID=UPI000424DA61|nr:type II toxin-antitoxin system VapC family toxin [Methylohalobius crimeensis]
MTYLLDSVILIDHFNGVEAATRYLKENAREIAISVITRAEVLTGFSLERETLAKALLDRIPHYPVTKDEADLAASLRRQLRWKLPDALQAAVALHHRLKLVTRNTKGFQPGAAPFRRGSVYLGSIFIMKSINGPFSY